MAKEKLAITCSQPRDDLTVSCRDTTGAALQMCDVIGKVVLTIFKIKGETLTIAGLEDGDQDQPKTSDSDKTAKIVDGNGTPNLLGFEPSALEKPKDFEDDNTFRYVLNKVQPQKQKNSEPPKSK